MHFVLKITALLLFMLPAHFAQAQTQSIAAIVNDNIITTNDLNDRLHMIITSSGAPATPEKRTQMAPQILDSLIEEEIKLQESKRLNFEVGQDELDQGFAALAAQNKMSAEEFKNIMQQSGISQATIERQIRTQIAWGKVVGNTLKPKINITEKDVSNRLDRLRDNIGTKEYLTAEIFLPVDVPSDEDNIRARAYNLADQIATRKIPFFQGAAQFSKTPSAAQGGDLGWIQKGVLPREVDDILDTLQKNAMSAPVRSSSGYHIILLRDMREITDESIPPEQDIRNAIGLKRLDRLQNSHFQDLKSDSFIEIRIES